jgi:hypothetical protein
LVRTHHIQKFAKKFQKVRHMGDALAPLSPVR